MSEKQAEFVWKEHLKELEVKKWRLINEHADKISTIILWVGVFLTVIVLILQR
jgi:hypothetical protein